MKLYVLEPLNAIQMQFVWKCTIRRNRSNWIVYEAPYVCDNQSIGTQTVMDFKICTQSYIIHMLVWVFKIVYIGSQGLVSSLCIHLDFVDFGKCNVWITPKPKFMLTYTCTLLTLFLKFTYIGPQGPESSLKNQLCNKKNFFSDTSTF